MMEKALTTLGISFAAGAAVFPAVLWLLRRLTLRQTVRDVGPESHQAKKGTPTMGGIGMLVVFMLGAVASGVLSEPRALAAVLVTCACFLIGFADDLSKVLGGGTAGVKARYRFAIQILLGLALCAVVQGALPVLKGAALREPSLVWMPFGLRGWNLGWWYWPFAVFVFVGAVNSVNFTDGLDGLLAGCFLAAGAALSVFIWRYGDRSLIPLCMVMMGAAAAFLWFNCHPASVFMGDCGSLMLGGFLASVALLTRGPIFLFVVGFIFVAEALSVIMQVASFRLTGRRIFRMSPIHHHFELAGWAEPRVVVRFWISGAVFAGLGLLAFLRR